MSNNTEIEEDEPQTFGDLRVDDVIYDCEGNRGVVQHIEGYGHVAVKWDDGPRCSFNPNLRIGYEMEVERAERV